MIDDARFTVTICGSFNLALPQVAAAVDHFTGRGAKVLSPSDPSPIEVINGFVFVASDRNRSQATVERRHLEAIAASRFVWLVAPDGYVGLSAAAEVAYAGGRGVPTYTVDVVKEPAIAALVQRVASPKAALDRQRRPPSSKRLYSFLVEPDAAADRAHKQIDELHAALTCTRTDTDMLKGLVVGSSAFGFLR